MKAIKNNALAGGILWLLLITFPIAMIIDFVNGIMQLVKYNSLNVSEKQNFKYLLVCGILNILSFGMIVDWVVFAMTKNRI